MFKYMLLLICLGLQNELIAGIRIFDKMKARYSKERFKNIWREVVSN
jgi:hypothetical protein